MARDPEQSLPKQCASWTDLIGAYRLLNNPRVQPQALVEPHVRLTRQICRQHPAVLCVQDTMEADFTDHPRTQGLGPIGRGQARGWLQHSALAVTPAGTLLGLLGVRWHVREDHETPIGRQPTCKRRARWRESLLWPEMVEQVGPAPQGCRLIHVMDAGGDALTSFLAPARQGVGFVIRACQYERCVNDRTAHLQAVAATWPVAGEQIVEVSARQGDSLHPPRQARQAKVTVSFGQVTLSPPACDGRKVPPLPVWGVKVGEVDPPTEVKEPIDWLLLTSEEVATRAQAQEVMQWYTCRWVIEEWHRVIKSGCKLERSQLDHGQDLARLAALVAVQAVRLLQLRDLASRWGVGDASGTGASERLADSPQALQKLVPWLLILVVSQWPRQALDPRAMTPRMFFEIIARRGGWLGRKGDGRPGWITLWRGWHDLMLMVQALQLPLPDIPPPTCV